MSAEDNRRTVLIVDDEAEVRKLVSAMISQLGYEVITADSGDHAMTLYQNHGGHVDLLITDVVAPGMAGPMLAERLIAVQPDLKVLYMSGYHHTTVVQKYVVEKGHALVTKPFTAQEMRARVKELVEPVPHQQVEARV